MTMTPGLQVPDYIRSLVPYVPGKPLDETRREYGIRRVIKLASNENPLGPSPKALVAVRKSIGEMHRYPDGAAFRLKEALSKNLGVTPTSIIVGNGSNEVIDFLVRTYCVPGDRVVTSRAAFIAYKLCAQIHGVSTLEATLKPDLNCDLGAMMDLIRQDERVRITFIANPNNPTGAYLGATELRAFLRELSQVRGGSVLAALDYAYWEYVTAQDLPDPIELMREFPNVVVLRTFSKIHGLAGFRIGYGVAAPEIISNLEKVRQPFNVNAMALVAAEAALKDKAFVRKSRQLTEKARLFWERKLVKMGIPFWPSQGNFLLADVGEGLGQSGSDVYTSCLRRGVIFRPVANYGLPSALRISFGTARENEIAAKALGEIGKRGNRKHSQ